MNLIQRNGENDLCAYTNDTYVKFSFFNRDIKQYVWGMLKN